MVGMKKSSKILIISGISLVAVTVAFVLMLAFNTRIYYGISAGGVPLGGKTVEEAERLLSSRGFFERMPDMVCDGVTFRVSADELGVSCDSKATATSAYNYGRDTNALRRIGNMLRLMFTPTDIPVKIKLDGDKLGEVSAKYLGGVCIPPQAPKARLEGDKLYITNGRDGVEVDRDELTRALADFVYNKVDKILLVTKPITPERFTGEGLHDEFACAPVNAGYSISGMRISYTPGKNGIDFDVDNADKVLKDNIRNPEEYFIPVTIIFPEHTIQSLDRALFGDCLGTYTSRYNPADTGRTRNVTLAAGKINGAVLNTGDIFSYNGLVGERTAERGFTGAKVYAGGEVVNGLGGGVCQVSSTLYNAVLYADLEVVSRTNHSLPVTYVPLGRDATVSYGTIDFKFKNQYNTPIRISTAVGGGVLTVSVWGKKTTDKTVEIRTEQVSTTPFAIKEEEDSAVAEGKTKVKQTGRDGAVVNTYKRVIENGRVVSDKFIHESTYTPISQIILVPPAPKGDKTHSESDALPTVILE